jgi:steroid 5-alpha reductase family enzyme
MGMPRAAVRSKKTPLPLLRTELKLEAVVVPPLEVWTSLLPPCLGFFKSEYTVSYGYGFATALTALSILRQPPNTMLFPWHARALVAYGLRLNLFLLVRTLLSSRMQDFNNNIETRAVARGNRFATRTPFVLSCGLLYYGLAAPVLFTSKLLSIPTWVQKFNVFPILIGAQWFGFGLAALGDLTKTYVKQSQQDERYLVTSGIFSRLRHPNYTGEIIGWTANHLSGLIAASLLWQTKQLSISMIISNLAVMTLGWVGILFVLLRASDNLEVRQKKDYGTNPKYDKWISSSWSGWQLPTKRKEEADRETPKIELDEDQEEDFGSGI